MSANPPQHAEAGMHTDAEHADVHPTDEFHPTPKQYVQIAIALSVLTAMEVSASYIELGGAFIPLLIILMSIKFVLVAGWFMHLKYDTRLYSRLLGAGLAVAITVYLATLLTFRHVIPVQ